jgi:hypothetical protein
MALLPIDENFEDGDRSVPELGFNGSFLLMMAICEHCKGSSINSRFKQRLSSNYDATNHFSIGNRRQLLLRQLADFAMQSHIFHTGLAVQGRHERRNGSIVPQQAPLKCSCPNDQRMNFSEIRSTAIFEDS